MVQFSVESSCRKLEGWKSKIKSKTTEAKMILIRYSIGTNTLKLLQIGTFLILNDELNFNKLSPVSCSFSAFAKTFCNQAWLEQGLGEDKVLWLIQQKFCFAEEVTKNSNLLVHSGVFHCSWWMLSSSRFLACWKWSDADRFISEQCCPVTELFRARGSTKKLGKVKALIVFVVCADFQVWGLAVSSLNVSVLKGILCTRP